MGSFHFHIRPQGTLRGLLSKMPERVVSFLRIDFVFLARFPESKNHELGSVASESEGQGSSL